MSMENLFSGETFESVCHKARTGKILNDHERDYLENMLIDHYTNKIIDYSNEQLLQEASDKGLIL